MAIIKQYHKDTDTTYVYESVSYWDEEKKQSRSNRRLIGKIDPATGDIIPTGKRGRKSKDTPSAPAGVSAELSRLYEESQIRIKELTLAVDQKDLEIARLQKEIQSLKNAFLQIDKHLSQWREICTDQAVRS